jgi:hypothetical protein
MVDVTFSKPNASARSAERTEIMVDVTFSKPAQSPIVKLFLQE